MMRSNIFIFIFLFASFSYAQDTNKYNTSIVVIRGKIYKMQHGIHKKGDSTRNTSLKYTKVGLSNVLFKTSKAELLPQAYAELDTLSQLLAENPNMNLKIEGHTDKIGDSKKNLKLSEKRARVIRLYLFNNGIKFERTLAIGHGDRLPICEAPCKKNQRVQFSLIDNGKKSRLSRNWDFDFDNMYTNELNKK